MPLLKRMPNKTMTDPTPQPLQHPAMAVDWGKKRIGLAQTDPDGMLVLGLETLTLAPDDDPVKRVAEVCDRHGIQSLVVGLPRHLNGTEGETAQRVRRFAERLQAHTGLCLRLFDERLTSVLAERLLRAQGIAPSRNKALVDQQAARCLMQDVLDQSRQSPSQDPSGL